MTYLAKLYGSAALVHSDLLRSQFDLTSKQLESLSKSDQNIDELLAHEAIPYFIYFSMPSMERGFRLTKKEWESMSWKYGNANGSDFDVETEVLGKYGPCTHKLLEQAFHRINIIKSLVRNVGVRRQSL